MLPLIVSAALAASAPVERVRAAIQNDPDTMYAMSCTPMGPLLETTRLAAETHLKRRIELGELLRSLPRDLTTTGLNPAGDLDVLVNNHDGNVFISVAFPGSDAQAEALLTRLFPQSLVIEPDGWSAASPQVAWDIRRADGALRFEAITTPDPTPLTDELGPLLDGLPDQDGCAFAFTPTTDSHNKIAVAGIAADYGLRVRVRSPTPALSALSGHGTPPLPVHTTTRPSAVITLGPPLLDLLASPAVPGPVAARLRELEQHIRIQGGTTIGIFPTNADPALLVMLPVTDLRGRPIPARRLSRALREALPGQGLPFEKTGKNSFSSEIKGYKVFVTTRKGLVLLATQAELVTDATTRDGDTWTTPADVDWARTWPLAIVMPELIPDLEGVGLRVGLGVNNDIIDVSAQLSGDIPDTATLLRALQHLGEPDAVPQLKRFLPPVPAP